MKILSKYIIIILLMTASLLYGKSTPQPQQTYPHNSSIISNPPITPLSAKWSINGGMLLRFYPDFPISESDIFTLCPHIFGLNQNYLHLEIKSHKSSPPGSHKRYAQYYDNIPVKNGEILFNLRSDNTIISVFNNIYRIENVNTTAEISLESSRIIAFSDINYNSLRAPESGQLMISIIDNSPHLTYQWHIPATEPYGDWEILIDAHTGEILSRQDMRKFSVTGSGRIFIPDPKTAIESDTLIDQGDANWAIPEECYSIVELLELNDAIAGLYVLSGPYADTSPTLNRAEESTPDFFYFRQDDRFEEVMAYYHLDTYQRYIQSLGFDDILNFPQLCNVNGTPDDNSWFSPMTGIITYGSGGVDDAEDADVILHEYGHAIHSDILPGWSGGHSGAMGEGFGDYIAGSYSLCINPDFHPEWVFTWDGHNQFWGGRRLNMPYHYPENANGEIHDSGQLWSAGLIDVWYDVPDVEVWDKLIFQHHYYLGNGATMEDAANAVLLADIEINDGSYRQIIMENFAERGFVDPYYLLPIIEHDPYTDSEDTTRIEYPVTAYITSEQPLDSTSILLFWGVDGMITDSLTMQSIGSDSFTANITGPFNQSVVNYYLSAADIYGGMTFLPENAPIEMFSFFVGADTIPPQIALLDTLQNTVFPNGSDDISLIASDNIGLALVKFYHRQENEPYQWLELIQSAEGDTFTATAVWEDMQQGMNFYYYFTAQDSSSNSNICETQEYSFEITNSALFDDFENGLSKWAAFDSWGIQSQRYLSPVCALQDRGESGQISTPEAVITSVEPWFSAGLTSLYLEYWTQYFFLPRNDTGFVDIKLDSEWLPCDTVFGVIGEWQKRTVNLSDFLQQDSLSMRFRTKADTSSALTTLGWFIDDVTLSVVPQVGYEDNQQLSKPSCFALIRVTPNPSNSQFTIRFSLPHQGTVKASVYNILGRKTADLGEHYLNSGENTLIWEGNQASGIYLLKLEFEKEQVFAKLLLLK